MRKNHLNKVYFLVLLFGIFITSGCSIKKSEKEKQIPYLENVDIVGAKNFEFNNEILNYDVKVSSDAESVFIMANPVPGYSITGGIGEQKISGEKTEVQLVVSNEKTTIIYKINLIKEKEASIFAEIINSKEIVLSTNLDGKILYTLDGTEPNLFSQEYTKGIPLENLSTALTIKAVVYKNFIRISDVETIKYNLLDMVEVKAGETNNIKIEKDFLIAKYPVTQYQFEIIMGFNPSYFVGRGLDKNPVENITWFDAVMYCNKLSERSSLTPYYTITSIEENQVGNIVFANVSFNESANGFRLPSSEEWQYTARGGKNGLNTIYSGSNNIENVAWYGGNLDTKDIEHSWTDKYVLFHKEGHGGNSVGTNANNSLSGMGTRPIGEKNPNELGIYDMSGNVWEWTNTSSKEYLRVMHGGSWFNNDRNCKVDSRSDRHPKEAHNYFGFRIAQNMQ